MQSSVVPGRGLKILYLATMAIAMFGWLWLMLTCLAWAI
jgi:hypothetical protein